MGKSQRAWPVKDARANFSTLVDKAINEGPQVVTRNGKRMVVVVAIDQWENRKARQGDLVEFFVNSPLRKEEIEIERLRDYPRELKF